MNEQYSNTSPIAWLNSGPDGWCWRMCQASFPLDLDEEADWTLLQRLPDWTMWDGQALSEQATPGHLIAVRDGSASPNLPTPASWDGVRGPDCSGDGIRPSGAKGTTNLATEMLTTPTAWLGSRPSRAIGDAERWHDPERSNELSDQMAALLPTAVVNDMGRGKTPEEWDSWTDEMKHRHGNGNGHGASLAIEIARLPGIATRLPSNDGNGSSDDQHQTQPTSEDYDQNSSSG